MSEGASHPILNTLNKAQCRAVTSTASTVAILAGPGSGKTHTLTSRVVWLIDQLGIQPCDIIVATFTVKAAREMKERIGRALGDGRERKIILGTFHSIARRYLAKYGKHIGLDSKFGIADDGDSKAVIQRICKRDKLSCDPTGARAWISKKKAKGALPNQGHKKGESVNLQHLQKCYDAYQDHLKTANLLDYDDLLVLGVQLLRTNPHCVSNVQAVLIDEYQDTNGVQYDLMKLLAQERSRITVVGDPDQSIYGWRSAEIRNLYRLLREFPETDEVSLEENYRSSHHILHVSLEVIKQDSSRYKKVLLPIHAKGTRPTLRKLASQPAEAEWVVSEIKRILLTSGNMMSYDDIAILLRSASLSRHLESALGKVGIAYRMVGGFKFYERAEIKTLIDYLRVIYQPDNNDALMRIINVPKRGIGDGTIKSLLEEAETSRTTLWSLLVKHCRGIRRAKTNIRKDAETKLNLQVIRLVESFRESMANSTEENPFTLVDLIDKLLEKIEFKKFLEDTYSEQHEQRWANVEEFMSLASDFLRDLRKEDDEALPDIEGLAQTQDADPLARFLANVSLASDVQKGDTEEKHKSAVTISTIHAAKGLEWPVIFIPAAYNGSIPHSRAEDTDEERRLLFVAMTRAKSLLYLSCPKRSLGDNGSEFELSQFLEPVKSLFAQRGPSFDRQVLKEIGRVLNRAVPTEEELFGDMPLMTSVEDDRFPLDPAEVEKRESYAEDPYDGFHQYERGAMSRAKRQKRPHKAARQGETEIREWAAPATTNFTTTMDAGFTVPGFTTAGAHQVALAAAGIVQDLRGGKQEAPQDIKQRPIGATKRPANQPSLLGFFKKGHGDLGASEPEQPESLLPKPRLATGTTTALHQISSSSFNRAYPWASTSKVNANIAQKPAIAPELAKHKLGGSGAKIVPPHNAADPVAVARGQRAEPQDLARNHSYGGCFSSSPLREGKEKENSEFKMQEGIPPSPKPPHFKSSSSTQGTGMAASGATTGVQKPMGLHGVGGFRRPMGMTGRDGGDAKALERLRRPFKPPAMRTTVGGSVGKGPSSGGVSNVRMTIGNTTMENLVARKNGR
ncbi:UvrD/REP helicase [Zalerion maritima]|uniref:DNA 3'-5' helicase n=1 Tax=Zalerion maritima TaxID=339359 RepID=A0AAD5RKP1_9PEZI|nr:UvrD/REP helicase [Zalerion maritima]